MKFHPIFVFVLCCNGLFTITLAEQDHAVTTPQPIPELQKVPVQADLTTKSIVTKAPKSLSAPIVAPLQDATCIPSSGCSTIEARNIAPTPDIDLSASKQSVSMSNPNSLMPIQEPSQLQSADKTEQQRQFQKVRYYSVKLKADTDIFLMKLKTHVNNAKSDAAKRQALRQYYDLLAVNMKKIDPDLASWIDTMHEAYLRRLDQVHVAPSILKNLPPTPNVSSLSIPSSQLSLDPHKKKSQ